MVWDSCLCGLTTRVFAGLNERLFSLAGGDVRLNKVLLRNLLWTSVVLLMGAEASAQTKVLIMPVTAVGEGISEQAQRGMLDALKEEISARGGIFVIDGRYSQKSKQAVRRGRKRKSGEKVRRAFAKLEDARRQMERLKFGRVIGPLEQVIADLLADIEMVDDYDQVVDAHLLLSVAYLTLRPDLSVDPHESPPMFLSIFNQMRQKVLRAGTGSLRVPGDGDPMEVYLNGRLMGRTPLVVDKVLVGDNHVRVVGSSQRAWGHIATVSENETTMVMDPLRVQGQSGTKTLAEKITSNRFDDGMRRELRTMGRKRGADYVVVLALGAGAGLLNCSGYIGDVRRRTWSRLTSVSPDVDMLSVGIEASTLVSSMSDEMKGFTSPIRGEVRFLDGVLAPARSRSPKTQRERKVSFLIRADVDAAALASATPREPVVVKADLDAQVAVRKPRSRSSAVPKRQELIPAEAVQAGATSGVTRLDLDKDLQELSSGSITQTWWFWTSIGVALAASGVATYFLAVHEGDPTDVAVSVSW